MARTSPQASTQQLLDDFDKLVRDSEALLRSLATVSGEKALSVRESLEENLRSAKTRVREIQESAMDKASGAAREADTYVRDNPWTAIGVAAAVGVVVGVILTSRR